ncbi:hypothetical protein [Polyangium jinanense]|uniref:hypothetical protein n=1 Tax=Polyangium jinanense TaxID=2829994 RepID=UPI002340CBAB|nr:hypothetical protein [Polyangium jinanense]
MPRLLRFLLLLLCGLALITAVGYVALTRTTHRWFESDLRARSLFVVTATKQLLARNWELGHEGLVDALEDITRDERVMGAAACTLDGQRLAATAAYPLDYGCRWVLARIEKEGAEANPWTTTEALPGGRVHLSAVTVGPEGQPLGRVLLVHDLSYLERREATTRNLLLVAFFVLSLGAATITMIASGWPFVYGPRSCGAPCRAR